MTVGKMRRIMLHKIVPEKIIPRNIVDFLMDEKAEPAEIDAYTFFNRLRELGVGSADFIYLLEGCGAPEEVVLKIKSNPAMNLQTLIRTVESAGMTSGDYTRILYTARQIWEHTLTSRIDLMESDMLTQDNSRGDDADFAEPAEESREPDEFRAAFDAVVEKNRSSERADLTSPDTIGFSLGETEEFESLLSGASAASDYARPLPPLEDKGYDEDRDAAIADSDEIIDEYLDEQNTIIPASPDDLRKDPKNFTVSIDYGAADADYDAYDGGTDFADFAGGSTAAQATAVEDIAEPVRDAEIYETAPEGESGYNGYNGDTTSIIKIDRAMLEENLANIARNAGAPDPSVDGSEDDAPPPARDEERAPIDDQYDEDYDYVRGKSRYYISELITAVMGALIVVCCGLAAGIFFGMEPKKPIGYAADENEIFAEIYYSHNERIAGGDSFYRYGTRDLTVFGDLLVEQDGFGTFTEGANVYTLTTEEISVNKLVNGELTFVGTLAPPENTYFADVAQLSDGAVVAAFDGGLCGYMKVSDGETLYTVRQDGSLTDFSADDNEVRLGSVYTPKFYTVFNVTNKEIYLPKLGVEYTPIEPQKVIPSETRGYSYGVAAAYSAQSGMTLRADAVLGNPVFASADGAFAVNGAETGLLIRADYAEADSETPPKVLTEECGKLANAAFFPGGSAVYEGGSVILRDAEFNTVSILQNLTSIPEKMRFCGNILLVSDKDKVFLAVDCEDLQNPRPTELRRVRGRVGDGAAVTLEQTAEGIRVASYKLDGFGKAVAEYEDAVSLNGEERGTLKLGGAAAIVATESLCGAAYSYFDGVSVVSEYVLLGSPSKRVTLYDDKTGFDIAFAAEEADGIIYARCSKGLTEIKG